MVLKTVLTIALLFLATTYPCYSSHPISQENIPVETLIGEAVSEGYEGMLAVAEVIRNRSKRRNLTPTEVSLQPKQFSFWNDKQRANKFLLSHVEWYQLAQKAWNESASSQTVGGADHYFADYIKTPYWAKSMEFTKQVGKHRFYRS